MTTYSTNTKIVGNLIKTGFHDHLPGVLFQVINSNLGHSLKMDHHRENWLQMGRTQIGRLPETDGKSLDFELEQVPT